MGAAAAASGSSNVQISQLSINVHSAKLATNTGIFSGNVDTFAELCVDGQPPRKTEVCKKTTSPKWDDAFTILVTPYSKIELRIQCVKVLRGNVLLGTHTIDLYTLLEENRGKLSKLRKAVPLTNADKKTADLTLIFDGLTVNMKKFPKTSPQGAPGIMFCYKCGKLLNGHPDVCEHCRASIGRGIDEELPKAMGAVQIEATQLTAKDDNTDLDNYELGSDSIADVILVSKEDNEAYEKILINSGFNDMIEKINKENNEWKNVIINIAIAGESGTGKSTLINALRNLKADDEGAAKIGCTETTKEPTPYPYRDNGNVKIWDLPGVGTPNFPQEKYLKEIQIERYDFILLVYCTRFKENDAWLAKEIYNRYPTQNLFFVRTKIDNDLEDFKKGHSKSKQKERNEQIQLIKKECLENLCKQRIPESKIRMFLINSHNTFTFDFGKLANMLVEKSSGLKRDAMILLLSSVSNEIVKNKIRVMKKRLTAASICAAMAADNSSHEKDKGAELDVLLAEGLLYQRQLGIDAHSIGVLARKFGKEEEEIYQQLNMRSHAILKTKATFAVWYEQFTQFKSTNTSLFSRIMEKILRIRRYQQWYATVLEELLKMCAVETGTLHTNLAVWRDE